MERNDEGTKQYRNKETEKPLKRRKKKYRNWPQKSWVALCVVSVLTILFTLFTSLALKYKLVVILVLIILSAVMLLISIRKMRPRGRLTVFIANIMLTVLVVIGMAGVKAASDAFTLKAKAKIMGSDLKTVVTDLQNEDFNGASTSLNQVTTTNTEMEKTLDGPFWKTMRIVPGIGKTVTSVRTLLDVVDEASAGIISPLITQVQTNPMSSMKAGEGKFNVNVINSYLDFVDHVMPVINEIKPKIETIDLSLIPSDSVKQYMDKLDSMTELYDEANRYLPVFRSVLGHGEDKLYVLAAQNTSEIRASGGFPGSVGTISINDGIMSLGDMNSVYDVLPYATPAAGNVSAQENQMFAGWLNYPRDACYDPDFSRVGSIWAAGYESNHPGETVDGVISLTPTIIQKILGLYGSITLSDGTTLDGTNATRVIEQDIYFKYFSNGNNLSASNDLTDQLFSETASQAMDLFVNGFSFKDAGKYAKIFADGAQDRTILLWMANLEEQNVMIQEGCAGVLNPGYNNAQAGVFFSTSDSSKLGIFFNMNTQVGEAVTNADGSKTYDVTVTLGNSITNDEILTASNYILGSNAGAIQGYLHLFAPVGGTISNFTSSDGMGFDEDNYLGVDTAYNLGVMVQPGIDITVNYQVTVAAGVNDPLTIAHTATLQDYR